MPEPAVEGSNKSESGQPRTLDEIAAACADAAAESISRHSDDFAALQRSLYDLKLDVVKETAAIFYLERYGYVKASEELLWRLAREMPDFSVEALFHKRSSLLSLGATVFLGWILGGVLSGFLGLLALGGDILRAAAIFAMLWLGEFLGSSPRARNRLLALLGLGALARFATSLGAGMFRLAGFGGLRKAVFGSGPMPSIFKSFWLLFWAFFLFIFLSKKITALDLAAFKQSLLAQISQSMRLNLFVLEELDRRDVELEKIGKGNDIPQDSQICPKTGCELAASLIAMLDSFEPATRRYLAEKLAKAGYEVKDEDTEYIIWNDEEHAPLYETIGLVRNGDRCRVLRRACQAGGRLLRGHVQRMDRRDRAGA